jgi:hypothetical protein
MLPFFKYYFYNKPLNFSPFTIFGLVCLTFYLTFSSPIIPPVLLLICPIALIWSWKDEYTKASSGSIVYRFWQALLNMNKNLLFIFMFVIMLSLYSFYIGTFNSENISSSIPLIERYKLLPKGLNKYFTTHPGLPLVSIFIGYNLFLIKRFNKNENKKKMMGLLKWIGILSFIYIVLLPFGGYRPYRPYIIRYDVMIPFTISLILLFGLSSFIVLKEISFKHKRFYIGLLVLFVSFFAYTDSPEAYKNKCEKNALKKIANSPEKIVELEKKCMVMSWSHYENYKRSSTATSLLRHWNIIEDEKYYYFK